MRLTQSVFLLSALLTTCLVLAVTGCAIDERVATSRDASKRAAQDLQHMSDRFQQTTQERQSPSSEHRINKPWVSGQPIALAPEVSLPKPLRTDVKTTLIFHQKAVSLAEVGQRIARATGIPVRVRPEAMLAAHYFMPRLQDVSTTTQASSTLEPMMPMGTRPLSEVLDFIAASHDVQWRYTGKAIELFRTETQVFDIRALALDASTQMQLGKTGGGTGGGFESSAQTTLSLTAQPLLNDIRQRVEPFMTRAGTISAQPGNLSSIVVTDTPEALAAIGRYLAEANRAMTRRVRLVFEEMSVTGSVLARAVSKYADIRRHTTVPVVTLNRRPVTHAVRSTFTYVDQIQSVGVAKKDDTKSALPGIAVSQKRETVGAFLTLVPDIQVDGQVLLSVAYDNTTALPLETLAFGGSEQSLQVQQLNLQGNGTLQQVALHPGRTTLIAGFEQRNDETQQARLSPDAPRLLGGHDKLEHRKSITLIFLTAQVEDGY